MTASAMPSSTATPIAASAFWTLWRPGIGSSTPAMVRTSPARLRIVTDRPLTEIPEGADDQAKLARRLGFDAPAAFLAAFHQTTASVRKCYDAITTRERP